MTAALLTACGGSAALPRDGRWVHRGSGLSLDHPASDRPGACSHGRDPAAFQRQIERLTSSTSLD